VASDALDGILRLDDATGALAMGQCFTSARAGNKVHMGELVDGGQNGRREGTGCDCLALMMAGSRFAAVPKWKRKGKHRRPAGDINNKDLPTLTCWMKHLLMKNGPW